jgi:enamine deaminase RidA (YjgF/YER057c/UK114 family)
MSSSKPHFIAQVPKVAPPQGYSMAVSAQADRLVYISGQVAFDEHGHIVGVSDFSAQVKQCFHNLQQVLAAAGCSFRDVIKFNYYVVDLDNDKLALVRSIRNSYLSDERPASTLVGVARLAHPDLRIEIEVIASIP